MADNKVEVEEDENVPEYKVSKKVSVDELLKMDSNDESLKKYKESLGLGAKDPSLCPPNDPRRVVIVELKVSCQGRPGGDIVYKFENKEALAKLKEQPFTLKEGCQYKLSVTFKVQHDIVSGLKYVNYVTKMGVKVSKDEIMIGSYAPQKDTYTSVFPRNGWDEAPSGMLARGKYKANSKFIDDDKQVHLEYDYAFEIKKDWE
eukprot:TRINITY_DN3662_c0_g1_i1.p1 TRINITY_DN3662_c0_g1~~TRINITY_DN3662_c0_g1_i1.p1  ORF type:complete len:203 (+),score=91.86 TRINITY_DN3662_c0_g1_i1:51-659(+)